MALQQKAYELLLARFGDGHPDVLAARLELGVVTGDAGKYANAVAILERLCDVYAKEDKPAGPTLAHVRHQLGLAYVRAGRPELGVGQIEWALDLWRGHQPLDGPDMLATRMSLGIAAPRQPAGSARPPHFRPVPRRASRGQADGVQILLAPDPPEPTSCARARVFNPRRSLGSVA